jgi:hypothetical protein
MHIIHDSLMTALTGHWRGTHARTTCASMARATMLRCGRTKVCTIFVDKFVRNRAKCVISAHPPWRSLPRLKIRHHATALRSTRKQRKVARRFLLKAGGSV